VEHVRLATLPNTGPWNHVVSLISSGANTARTFSTALQLRREVDCRPFSRRLCPHRAGRLFCVLVFCNRVGSRLDKSIRYQPIKSLPFICFLIRGPFRTPSTHEIAKDCEFFVADSEYFCHLTAFSKESPPLLL
jgi:hypothetical protein